MIVVLNSQKVTKTITKTRCLAIILTQMYPLFRELLVNTQGTLITATAEFDVTFDFAIYLCDQKCNRKIERSKNLPKCLSLMVTFYIRGSKLMLF